MAKPKASKQREAEASKTRLYLTVDSALVKRYRHAGVDLDLTESELFERVVAMLFSGVHARGMSESVRASLLNEALSPAGETPQQGGSPAQTVRITGVTNRIGDIARRAHGPVDDALDGLANESA